VTAVPLGSGGRREVLAESYENGQHVRYYGDMCKGDRVAVYDGGWKYIKASTGRRELYDLSTDEDEKADMKNEAPVIAAGLEKRITDWQEATPLFDGAAEASQTMSAGEMERLRSLGYLGGSPAQ